jgi:histidinol-phosphatase
VQTRGKVWDYAAPALIVTDAGGWFSRLNGEQHLHTGPALYSADPEQHRAALAYLDD